MRSSQERSLSDKENEEIEKKERMNEDFRQENSHKKYQHLFETSPFIIGLCDLEGYLLEVNNSAKKILGIQSTEEIIGKHYSEILNLNPKNNRLISNYEPYFLKFVETEKPFELEFPLYNSEDEAVWIHFYSSILKIGNKKYMQIILQDITKQQEAIAQLKESQKQFKELFNYMSSGCAIYKAINNGENFIFKDLNYSSEKIEKINKHELLGKKVTEVFPGIKEFGLFEVFQDVWRTGKPQKHPISKYKDNRITGWRENYVYKLPSGEIVAIYNDVTEKKQSEQKLENSERFSSTLLENSPNPILVINPNKSIRYINPAFEDLTGFNASEILNRKTPYPWWFEEGLSIEEKQYRLYLKNASNKVEDIFKKKDGTKFWVDITTTPIQEKGELKYFLVNWIDITGRKEAEQKYFQLFNDAPYGIILAEKEGKIIDLNSRVKEITGYKRKVFLGKKFLSLTLYDKQNHKILKNAYLDFLNEGHTTATEFQIRKKNGEVIWVSLEAEFVRFGNKKYIQGILHDITKEKVIETNLKHSEKKYRTLYEASPIGIGIADLEGNVLDINKRMEEITGYSLGEYKKINLDSTYVNPEDRRRMLQKIKKDGKIRNYIIKLRKKTGEIYVVKTNIDLVEIEGDKILFTSCEDISDQIKAQEKLRESEEKFRTILEQTLVGICILQDFEFVYVNEAFADMIGSGVDEILEFTFKKMEEIIHPEDRKEVVDLIVKVRHKKDFSAHFQCRGIKKNKDIAWFDSFARSINYRGKSAILITINEITTTKHAEKQLIKLNNYKSTLLRRASHELKTPLVSIKGFTNLLLELYRDVLDQKGIRIIKEIYEGCKRLETLVSDILHSSKMRSGNIDLSKKKVVLAQILEEVVQNLKGAILARKHSIKLNIDKNCEINADKEKLLQVFENIVLNAINNTPSGGKIDLNLVESIHECVISIRDNGVGFTNDEKEHLFTPFGKIERYGKGYDVDIDGSGLGLYISRRIIEEHEGKIWLESEGRNKGAVFYISLPKSSRSNINS
ncbi:MAG: putative Signal transduction histidine kinase [Promethearchaeota archaeon]|nr:MAG: putative Signal transduction histidine kinase [Candidatus Lokiarchaeota archaeon]